MDYKNDILYFNVQDKYMPMGGHRSSIMEIQRDLSEMAMCNNVAVSNRVMRDLHLTLMGACKYSSVYRSVIAAMGGPTDFKYMDPVLVEYTEPEPMGDYSVMYLDRGGLDGEVVSVLRTMFSRLGDESVKHHLPEVTDKDAKHKYPAMTITINPDGNPDVMHIATHRSLVHIVVDLTHHNSPCKAHISTFDAWVGFYMRNGILKYIVGCLRDIYITPHDFPKGLYNSVIQHIRKVVSDHPLIEAVANNPIDYEDYSYLSWHVAFTVDDVEYTTIIKTTRWEGLVFDQRIVPLYNDPLHMVQLMDYTLDDFTVTAVE